jgi:hypothetical protein
MRKDVQKRLLTVAAVLDRTAGMTRLALEQQKPQAESPFWKKFFRKEQEKTLNDLQEKDDTGALHQNQRVLDKPKDKVHPPLPATDELPVAKKEDVAAFAEFLKGGLVPFEVVNPLAQMAKSMANAGAISAKDVKSVVSFMAKMLRKYVGGQKLAKVSAAGEARKARIAAREAAVKTASFSEQLKAHIEASK